MAIIPMTSGFSICPEGKHIFRIYKVDYDPDFGKLVVHMVNAQGIKHMERFSLMNTNGEMNDKACNAFSFFAKTALNNFSIAEIDHNDLVNRYIGLEIVHTHSPSRNDPTKTVTFANASDKWVADGFDTTPVAKALSLGNETEPTQESAPSAEVDLNSLLD